MVRLRFKNGVSGPLLAGNGDALVAQIAPDGLAASVFNAETKELLGIVSGTRKAYTLKALRNFLVGYGVTFKDEVRVHKANSEALLTETDSAVV